MKFIIGLIFCSLLGTCALAADQEKDSWEPIKFLLGTWTGGGNGKPGDAVKGVASFAFDLDRNIVIRKSRTEFAPKPGETKSAVHEDLMIIYPETAGARFRAVYFDSEGHMIHYWLTFPAKQPSAIFETDPMDKGPRFRLIYEPGAAGELTTEFLIASPGGEFTSYIKGAMTKSK